MYRLLHSSRINKCIFRINFKYLALNPPHHQNTINNDNIMPIIQPDNTCRLFESFVTDIVLDNIDEAKKKLLKFDNNDDNNNDNSNLDNTSMTKLSVFEIQDMQKRTALMYACEFSTPEVIALVFEKMTKKIDADLLKKQLLSTNDNGENCLMLACRNTSSSSSSIKTENEAVKVIVEKIASLDDDSVLLQSMLSSTDNKKQTCLMHACRFCDQTVCSFIIDRIAKFEDKTENLLKAQLVSKNEDGMSCLTLACAHNHNWAFEVITLLFDKIVEIDDGGSDLLKNQLITAADDEFIDVNTSCLHAVCSSCSSSAASSCKALKLVTEKIVEVLDGKNFLVSSLKDQLALKDVHGRTPLMLVCQNSSSLESIEFITNTIADACGNDFFRSQLAAIDGDGYNCLMLCCVNDRLQIRAMKFLLDKIVEVQGGGEQSADVLKTQCLAAKDFYFGRNCLLLACQFSSSPAVVEILLDKIIEIGNAEFFTSEIVKTSNDGRNCIMMACSNTSSSTSCVIEIITLVISKIVQVCGEKDLVISSLLQQMTGDGKTLLNLVVEENGNNNSKDGIIVFIASLLFKFDLFKEQYEKLSDECRDSLRKCARINDAEWIPTKEEPDDSSI